ncbi:MarR family winged helix-turn-helix transcriptional regulator [Paracraurococcus ruber]|uniref:MarR family transcriptional regulator n=1 Tax=Paracraurococcus ruber TaxID=77675 RepID=A0ABS1D2X0_9PROT|nr:MarR family winged helix-turn-helix transcriptional regulator [Paracraurococcus ruber]MBK1661139.1 MarR family transcriptional regulator [Paracraurococcus ruber]TDG30180.1 MarR family transcriptional regulator [Paracraurococcus ruber]
MTAIPPDAVVAAWVRLVRARHRVLGAVEAELKRAGFPPLAWYDALLELRRAGEAGLRPYQLEGAMLLAQYNLSRLVDRLAAAGHVVRAPTPADGRGQVLTITERGCALLAAMWPAYAAAIGRHMGAHLTEAEAATLAALLDRLLAPPAEPG